MSHWIVLIWLASSGNLNSHGHSGCANEWCRLRHFSRQKEASERNEHVYSSCPSKMAQVRQSADCCPQSPGHRFWHLVYSFHSGPQDWEDAQYSGLGVAREWAALCGHRI